MHAREISVGSTEMYGGRMSVFLIATFFQACWIFHVRTCRYPTPGWRFLRGANLGAVGNVFHVARRSANVYKWDVRKVAQLFCSFCLNVLLGEGLHNCKERSSFGLL